VALIFYFAESGDAPILVAEMLAEVHQLNHSYHHARFDSSALANAKENSAKG